MHYISHLILIFLFLLVRYSEAYSQFGSLNPHDFEGIKEKTILVVRSDNEIRDNMLLAYLGQHWKSSDIKVIQPDAIPTYGQNSDYLFLSFREFEYHSKYSAYPLESRWVRRTAVFSLTKSISLSEDERITFPEKEILASAQYNVDPTVVSDRLLGASVLQSVLIMVNHCKTMTSKDIKKMSRTSFFQYIHTHRAHLISQKNLVVNVKQLSSQLQARAEINSLYSYPITIAKNDSIAGLIMAKDPNTLYVTSFWKNEKAYQVIIEAQTGQIICCRVQKYSERYSITDKVLASFVRIAQIYQ